MVQFVYQKHKHSHYKFDHKSKQILKILLDVPNN